VRNPSRRQSDDESPEPTASRHSTDPDGTAAPHDTPVTLAAADRARPTAQPSGHLPVSTTPWSRARTDSAPTLLGSIPYSATPASPMRGCWKPLVISRSGPVSSATSLNSDVDRQRPLAQRHHHARDHQSDDIAHQPGTHAHRRPLLLPAESDCCYLKPNSRQEGN
jgi:hypothetical protein